MIYFPFCILFLNSVEINLYIQCLEWDLNLFLFQLTLNKRNTRTIIKKKKYKKKHINATKCVDRVSCQRVLTLQREYYNIG